jgi:uncharacterized LabA/DUF88 family protein
LSDVKHPPHYGGCLTSDEALKPTVLGTDRSVKGNVDADLVLKATTEITNYDKAVIISNDGDFYSLVYYLYQHSKLRLVLSPNKSSCSFLLRQAAKETIQYMDDLWNMLEYK